MNAAFACVNALNDYLSTYSMPRLGGLHDACLDHYGMEHSGYTATPSAPL
ncbi:hypothetical protein ACWGQ5_45875 [Streptomyces sp. NPDC055722]|jgi:hypothetical protein